MDERILVALDGSSESWNAFEYALDLAERLDLEKVTAVHSQEGGDETDMDEYKTDR